MEGREPIALPRLVRVNAITTCTGAALEQTGGIRGNQGGGGIMGHPVGHHGESIGIMGHQGASGSAKSIRGQFTRESGGHSPLANKEASEGNYGTHSSVYWQTHPIVNYSTNRITRPITCKSQM